jgi:hypothetical protein
VRLHFSEVKPSLDIYPLGKVLWSMISGRDGFPYWEFDRPENNLQAIFPEDPGMPLVNSLLGKCIVREEKHCVSRAVDLVAEVDHLLEKLRRIDQRPENGGSWPCRMCGRGRYVKTLTIVSGYVEPGADRKPLRVFACDRCGHAELFDASNSPR